MLVREIARALGARVIADDAGGDVEIDRVFAGDRVSDLLREASPSTLIVTNLASRQLFEMAELMDVRAICIASSPDLDPAVALAGARRSAILLLSPSGMFETCGVIHRLLFGGEAVMP